MLSARQAVTVHDADGISVRQFGPENLTTLRWTRELQEVSTCDVTLPPDDSLDDVTAWVHSVSVWDLDAGEMLWDGPILKTTVNRDQVVVSARDAAAWMARTRTPIIKAWDKVDLSVPAAEMWLAMADLHGLHLRPIVRADPWTGNFDYANNADATMMDQAIAKLAQLGLRWTVVAGVPILGRAPRDQLATLSDNDFVGGVELVRDGSASYNDVVLRGPDTLARARADMRGLTLQTIVNAPDMFGVTNADAAAREYVGYFAQIRDAISVPEGATLHPEAPVSYGQLIPSARFGVAAYGRLMAQELDSITVTLSAGKAEVSVKMESVLDLPENLPELATLDSTTVQHG